MNLFGAIFFSTVAVGATLAAPSIASASSLQCNAEHGVDATNITGATGCRAVGGEGSRARAAGYDGVGYARASSGALALGVGAAGGVGASEGVGGIPFALGLGPDATALSTVTGDEPTDGRSLTVAIALQGSRAEVSTAPGNPTVCLGTGAFGWDMRSGAACLATPFGTWQLPAQPR